MILELPLASLQSLAQEAKQAYLIIDPLLSQLAKILSHEQPSPSP